MKISRTESVGSIGLYFCTESQDGVWKAWVVP